MEFLDRPWPMARGSSWPRKATYFFSKCQLWLDRPLLWDSNQGVLVEQKTWQILINRTFWKKVTLQTKLISCPSPLKQGKIKPYQIYYPKKMWRSCPPDLAPKIGWHIIPARQHSRPVPVFRASPWLCRVHTAIVSTLDLVLFQCEKLQQNISRINERIRSWVSFQDLVCWSVYQLQKMRVRTKIAFCTVETFHLDFHQNACPWHSHHNKCPFSSCKIRSYSQVFIHPYAQPPCRD